MEGTRAPALAGSPARDEAPPRADRRDVPPTGRWRAAALLGAIAVGAAIRLWLWGTETRPLYIDEAFVALNVGYRSFTELLHDLDWDQTPHLAFLWLERLSVLLFGMGERALRLPALVSGLALMPAAWWAGRRLLGRDAALLATAIIAISGLFSHYSNDAKPYQMDALVTVLLVAATASLIAAPESRARWWRLGVGGAVAVLLSTPALFVLAGIGATLLLSPQARRVPGGVRRIVLLGACWVAVFAAVFFLLLRPAADNPYLQFFFTESFLDPRSPRFKPRVLHALWVHVIDVFYSTEPLAPPNALTLTMALGLAGLVGVWRRHGVWAVALLTLPIAAAAAASAVERYPIIPRTMLFAAPLMVFSVAAGVATLASLLPRRVATPVFAVAATLLLIPSGIGAVRRITDPRHVYDIRMALAAIRERGGPEDPVFLSYDARAGWAYYTADWASPDTARLKWLERSRHARVPEERQESADALRPSAEGVAGDPFVRRAGARVEIISLMPEGVTPMEAGVAATNRANHGPRRAWAAWEAGRIRAHANPQVWLVCNGIWQEELLGAVRAAGGRVEFQQRHENVTVYQVRFANPGALARATPASFR